MSPRWPKQQSALLHRGFPLPAVLRQTEQAQPSREREQLAQQLSRALRCCCCLPLPPCKETLRCFPSASLPFTHITLLLLEPHLKRRRVTGLGDGGAAQKVSSVSPSFLTYRLLSSLPRLPQPDSNTQARFSKHDLQLNYQRAEAPRAGEKVRERERGKMEEKGNT